MFNKYYERGYVPIPVLKEGKNPVIKEWSRYCSEKPSQQTIDQWEESFKGYNLGITCGRASGIIVVDIDTDDKDFLDSMPRSTVVRRGAKGEARFFQYDEKIKSQSLPLLDILSDGRQVVIPPSIHPLTKKPYTWLTPDTLLDLNANELPKLDVQALLKEIEFLKNGKKHSSLSTSIKGPGRNNKLVSIVTAMRGRGMGDLEVTKEIYEHDKKFHSPRLFTDQSEGYKATTEQEGMVNAWKFVSNVTKSLLNSGAMPIMLEDSVSFEVTEAHEISVIERYKSRVYPEPTGLIKDIQDVIIDSSKRYAPNLALGGAISIMAAICANRYQFDGSWSNMYILNLAPTGLGKSFPQDMAKKILDEKTNSGLIGFGNYQSSNAFVKDIVTKRERLDIIDEVSDLFAKIKSGGHWQSSIEQAMCKMWSSAHTKFLGDEYAGDDRQASTCYNPCVSLIGGGTIENVKENLSKKSFTSGLIPRFVIFYEEKYGKRKYRNRKDTALLIDVCRRVTEILKVEKRKLQNDILKASDIYDPIEMEPVEQDAIDLFEAIDEEIDDRLTTETSETIKEMLTRGIEQIKKLALVHAVGNNRRVAVQDLRWAKDVFEVSLHNATTFLEESSSTGDWEKDLIRVEDVFKKHGSVNRSKLVNTFRRIPSQRLFSILEQLKLAEKIVESNEMFQGKRVIKYTWIYKT